MKLFIAVEGPDGCGKSTFIDGLGEKLANFYGLEGAKIPVYHFRPNFLPNLGKIGAKTGIMKEDTNFTYPHRGKPANKISSLIRMLYYWLDYLIGIPILLGRSKRSNNTLIFDRYIYDFLIDPYRSRINLPYWTRKIITSLVIQPHIVFILVTEAETVYKRKQELTVSEISRQFDEFSKLSKSNNRFKLIDASALPEEMVQKAMKLLVQRSKTINENFIN